MFKNKEKIVAAGSMKFSGKILFVARGSILEKDGAYDDIICQMKYS
jgi:hypothetical protein